MPGKKGQTQALKYHGTCMYCGKSYLSARPSTKYCSEKCYTKAYHRSHRPKKKNKHYAECRVCGEKFLKYGSQVYCSKSCAGVGKRTPMAPEIKNIKDYAIIKIIRSIPVKPEFCVPVGAQFEAYICRVSEKDPENICYIIPGIGQYGLIVRREEALVVDELGKREFRVGARGRPVYTSADARKGSSAPLRDAVWLNGGI